MEERGCGEEGMMEITRRRWWRDDVERGGRWRKRGGDGGKMMWRGRIGERWSRRWWREDVERKGRWRNESERVDRALSSMEVEKKGKTERTR